MYAAAEIRHIPSRYKSPLERGGRVRWTFLNVSVVVLLLALSYLFLQLNSPNRGIILGLGVFGFWRHGWGLINFIRAVRYKIVCRRNKKLQMRNDGSLVVIATFYNQSNEDVTAVTQALAGAVSQIHVQTYLVCAYRTDDQKAIISNGVRDSKNIAVNFIKQHGLGKREALADCLSVAELSYSENTLAKAYVLLIDGDTIVTKDAIEQSIAQLQHKPKLGAVVVNEIPFSTGTELFNQWRMLRSVERNKLMCSFALSGRVLVLTGRFSMFRANIILQTNVINRIRKDFIRRKNLHISLLTGDDKTTWLEILRRRKLMSYLPNSYVFPIETPKQSDSFVKCTYELLNRYSGNMARANLHKDAWVGVKNTVHFGYGLLDQRVSMWTSLLTPVFLLYFLIFENFGIFVIALTYALLIKHLQAIALWLLSGIYDPWYPYLIFYNQITSAIIKVRAFAYLHKQSWTNQKIFSAENCDTGYLDKKARRKIINQSLFFVLFITLLYVSMR